MLTQQYFVDMEVLLLRIGRFVANVVKEAQLLHIQQHKSMC